jgi:hypothetical protein
MKPLRGGERPNTDRQRWFWADFAKASPNFWRRRGKEGIVVIVWGELVFWRRYALTLRRISVDIDLVYLPREDRPSTLRGIDAALQRIAAKIRSAVPTLEVREHQVSTDKLVFKLTVRVQGGAEVKIEPNTVRFREITVAPWAHCGPSVDWARFPRALR